MLWAGCATAPVRPPGRGESSFTFLSAPPQTAAAPEAVPDTQELVERYTGAVPDGELVRPEVPPALLRGKFASSRLYMQVTIDATGRVSGLTPSAEHVNIPGPHMEELNRAIAAAVAQWQFIPATHETLEWVRPTVPDMKPYLRRVHFEKVPMTGIVRFDFSVSGSIITPQ